MSKRQGLAALTRLLRALESPAPHLPPPRRRARLASLDLGIVNTATILLHLESPKPAVLTLKPRIDRDPRSMPAWRHANLAAALSAGRALDRLVMLRGSSFVGADPGRSSGGEVAAGR